MSTTIEQVLPRLTGEVTAGAFANALLERDDLPAGGGEPAPTGWWLDRCAAILVPTSVPDAPTVLAALARLEPDLGRALRRLGHSGEETLAPWARRPRVLGYAERFALAGEHSTCSVSRTAPVIATGGYDGRLQHWDANTGAPGEYESLTGTIIDCVYGSDGWFAQVHSSGAVFLTSPSGDRGAEIGGAIACALGGGRVALMSRDGAIRVLDAATRTEVANGFPARSGGFALGPDGREVIAPSDAGATLWDLTGGAEVFPIPATGCLFSPSGQHVGVLGQDDRLVIYHRADGWHEWIAVDDVAVAGFSPAGDTLVVAGAAGIRAFDVVTGAQLGTAAPMPAGDGKLSVGHEGLVAVSHDGGTTVFEPITATVMLPAVSPDSIDGTDLLNVAVDAAALADVIAAKTTVPPLSIGLFADWGSGKSFLIRQVQQRVRLLSRRARRDPAAAAHCAHVRNVEFNAWHFADANLWASLATHILDELAAPEPDSGVGKEDAAAQLARLEQKLADRSSVSERLERARRQTERAEARRQLVRWTWGLTTGADSGKTLAQLKGVGTRLRLFAPTAIVIALVIGGAIAALGLDRAEALAGAVVALGASLGAGVKWLGNLLDRAGPATSVGAVRAADAAADARAAKASEAELRQELADLASGRRLARYAAERDASGDYRSQLGLVSRIHEDFKQMSQILATQGTAAGDGDLPQIDRIVLYIDDLDRCPPKRVVEVLEAVHLILALPLFVVVLAVDPRWLLQSLKLHYHELLDDDGQLDPEWESTPLNYLEKIIQIPFTLRPMGESGTSALVASLLPVTEAVEQAAVAPSSAAPADSSAPATSAATRPTVAPRPPATSFSPRALALTAPERDFAALVARELRTPRAVKKLTNLYRLVRARLDEESGELDAFLATDYRSVLVILTVLIAWPGEAAPFLLGQSPKPDSPIGTCLARHAMTAADEPIRRWAFELSRYSFETGQEVYSKR